MQEMQELWVQSLGGEDPPEKSMTTHSSILAWRIPWTQEPGGHDWSNWARSFAKLYPTVCNPMDCSTPGFPVLHCLPKFPQTHVLWVSDAIQSSHPLSLPSPPALNLCQHQGPRQNLNLLSESAPLYITADTMLLCMSAPLNFILRGIDFLANNKPLEAQHF